MSKFKEVIGCPIIFKNKFLVLNVVKKLFYIFEFYVYESYKLQVENLENFKVGKKFTMC